MNATTKRQRSDNPTRRQQCMYWREDYGIRVRSLPPCDYAIQRKRGHLSGRMTWNEVEDYVSIVASTMPRG